jgi:hypothetical protein
MATTNRYAKVLDCPDRLTADVCYVDRTTGHEVLRFDGADPANTKESYGGRTDKQWMLDNGRDASEEVDDSQVVEDESWLGRYTEPQE